MYSRNYLNDDFLNPSVRNSNEALMTTEDLCAWNFNPQHLTPTTQYNFFPVHSKPIKNKSPNQAVKGKTVQSSFNKRHNKTCPSPVNNEKEKKILNKSLDEAEYRFIDFCGPKGRLPPLKLGNYNVHYKTAAKERTLEGFLNRCKEMIKESAQNRMKSASPCKYSKKFT